MVYKSKERRKTDALLSVEWGYKDSTGGITNREMRNFFQL